MAISKLEWQKMRFDSSTMVDSNSLAQALMTKPEISNIVAYAMGDKYYLQYLTQGSGRVSNKYTKVGNVEYKWWLQGDLTHPVPITAAVSPSSNIGLNFSPFTITVGEPYFATGDVVKFRSGTQARIQNDGAQYGSEWAYSCIIVGSDPTATVPSTDVAIGELVVFLYTAFEEGSEGGSSKRAFPMAFQNQLTTSRWSYAMTGSAATDVVTLYMKTDSGKEQRLWIPMEEFNQMKLWMQQSEYLRWYGIYNRTTKGEVMLPGKNGRPVLIGAGVLDQIANSHVRTYSVEGATEQMFRDFMIDIQIASKEAENKKILIFTGAGGMNVFDSAMKESRKAAQIVDTTFVSKTSSGLKFGENFTTYKGLLGTEITLVHLPLFDDKSKNPVLHPKTGLPYESYRMVWLDFSDYGGEPNISLITKGTDGMDRSALMWYTAGSMTPEGGDSGVKKVLRSHSRDGFECHFLSETGIKVTNPLSCGQLYIPIP
jgi:hypothetical protein